MLDALGTLTIKCLGYDRRTRFSPILQGILAPFTDLHYNHGIEIPDSQLRYKKSELLLFMLHRRQY